MEEKLKLLYEENGRTHRYYQDWRHRVIVRFAAVTAFTVFASIQVYPHEAIRSDVISLLFMFLAMSALTSMLMDLRNWRMINSCEEAGAEIEKRLFKEDPGFTSTLFFSKQDSRNKGLNVVHTYNVILVAMYSVATIACFSVSVWVRNGSL